MSNEVDTIKEILGMIPELKAKFGVKRNPDTNEPLLFAGVAQSNVIDALQPLVEAKFGKPYKAAGESAILKNWFDGFVKNVGGVRSDQTLFRKDLSPSVTMYCAFWPWGSNPVNTSIRIGVLCTTEDEERKMEAALKGCFK